MPTKYSVEDAPKASKYTVEDSTPPPPPPSDNQSWWDRVTAPLTEIQKPDPNAPALSGKEAVKAAGNIGAGGLGVVLHPINTLAGIGGMITWPYEMAAGRKFGETVPGQMVQSLRENPLGTVEAGIGQAGATPFLEAEGKAATAPIRVLPKVLRKGAEILSGTTPKVAEELGTKTAEANAAAQAKADTANAAYDAKRQAQLEQHHAKTQDVRTQNEAAQAAQSRKAALNRGVEQLDPKFQDDLKATEKNVRAQANKNYNDVRAATAGETVPSASLAEAVKTAEAKIQGSSENLKVFRDILSKHPEGEPEAIEYQGAQIPKGHPLYDVLKEGSEASTKPASFSDLQGYYSELGDKLSSGNLPGDVYQAMKSLQGSIGDLMQQMAESKGVGDQLTNARAFYRDYMNAFRERTSPLWKAMNATERGKSIAALRGADQSGIETLARYNPELAQRANTIRGYQAEAKAIPARTPVPKSEPTLPPRKPPTVAEIKKLGLKDIQQAKEDVMTGKKSPTEGRVAHIATGAGTWHIIRSAMFGNPLGVVTGAGVASAPLALGKILRNPAVVRILSAPTPADIASIPPDVRGPELQQIVQTAQKSGIHVHPAIVALSQTQTQNAQPQQ